METRPSLWSQRLGGSQFSQLPALVGLKKLSERLTIVFCDSECRRLTPVEHTLGRHLFEKLLHLFIRTDLDEFVQVPLRRRYGLAHYPLAREMEGVRLICGSWLLIFKNFRWAHLRRLVPRLMPRLSRTWRNYLTLKCEFLPFTFNNFSCPDLRVVQLCDVCGRTRLVHYLV